MKDEIKEILDKLNYLVKNEMCWWENYTVFSPKDTKLLLDYITNLQTIEQQYSAILSENAELENKITDLQEELEEEKRIEQASLDTINNLQDTLKDREEYCYGLETQLTNLQEENERLKQDYINVKNYILLRKVDSEVEDKALLYNIELENINKKKYLDYKSRNEKAIEKLESIRVFGLRSGKTLISTLINETVDILKGKE